MAEPLRVEFGAPFPTDTDVAAPRSRGARVRAAVGAATVAVLGVLVRPARLLPGLAAIGCAVAGSWLLWGIGVALLVAVPFLLILDARTPRG